MPTSLQTRRVKPLISGPGAAVAGAVLLIILGFSFYWFQLRPIRLYRQCTAESSADARKLLANKATIAQGTAIGNEYQNLLQKNMYLRTDFESFLRKCLLFYGLNAAVENIDPLPMSSSSSSRSSSRR
jgi:hypothetical protein